MPAYLTLPASMANRPLLVPGRNLYVFGGKNAQTGDTLAYVTNVALTSNVATVTLQLYAGAVPTTSQLVTLQGCSNSVFNIIGAAITGVSGFNTGDNSTGTITYAVTHADVVSVAGSGMVVLPVAETTDALTSNLASIQVTVPFNDPRVDQSRTVTAQVSYPSLPTSVVTTLQGSDDDVTYFDIATVASVTAGVQTGGLLSVANLSYRFYRLNNGTVSGGSSPTIIGKISA